MGELDGQGDDEAERRRRSPDDAQPPKESINEGAEHIDLAAVQDDDALIDALNRGESEVAGKPIAERELGALLMAWRQDLDTDPLPETSRESVEAAVAEWPTSHGARRRRPRVLVPLATAAAVLAIAFTGVGVAARDARPGDTLWGLTRVLYSEQAASVEAATTARSHLDLAQAALRAGEYSQAKEALEQARLSFDGIGAGEDKATLLAMHERLLGELNDPDGDDEPPAGGGDSDQDEPPPHIAESSEESAEEEPPVSVVTTTPETTVPSAPEPSDPSPTTPPSSPPDATDPDTTDSSAPDGSRSDEESPSVGNRISLGPGAAPEDAAS
ncbi:anti-sigma-D factor RsdA [Actinoalloteichus spitiensis]|uniref:anti-sigma-D factor RsdA n=1 Tax=Actinoalloteichus spitiensis TaxID=252394 RepID=UPI0003743FCB|nr:anti-sigma-D factor RsdA [Actinoalloteichus spitiensis]